MDRVDPRGLSHKSACPHPITPEWEYYKKYKLKNFAELGEHQLAVRNLEETHILDTHISTKTSRSSHKRNTSQPTMSKPSSRAQSADTEDREVQTDTQSDDGSGSEKARKVAKQTLKSLYHPIPVKGLEMSHLACVHGTLCYSIRWFDRGQGGSKVCIWQARM